MLLLITSAGCSKAGSAGAQGGGGLPPAGVQIVTLAPTEILDTTEYIGTLKSRRSITVQPQVEGQLLKIYVKSGDGSSSAASTRPSSGSPTPTSGCSASPCATR